jgi:Gpi18-like mannosyltransferase
MWSLQSVTGIASLTGTDDTTSTVIAGVLLSHTAHWLAAVQLWFLTRRLVDGGKNPNSLVPFRAAALHIISPAGAFLSAPYAESLFAFLSISGFLGYVYAVHYFNHARAFTASVLMVVAGVPFGLATIVRGNGILAGVTYLLEAIATAYALLTQDFTLSRLLRLSSVVAGGLLIAVGMMIPQSLAYMEYCLGRAPEARRSWCNGTIPSIFTWVQSHYWYVVPIGMTLF